MSKTVEPEKIMADALPHFRQALAVTIANNEMIHKLSRLMTTLAVLPIEKQALYQQAPDMMVELRKLSEMSEMTAECARALANVLKVTCAANTGEKH